MEKSKQVRNAKNNKWLIKLHEEEVKILDEGTQKAKDAVVEILKNGVDKAMNIFNI